MSVRKRTWTTRQGEQREAWIVVYSHNGKRHIETFARKKDADARQAQVRVNIKSGVHVAPSETPTVEQAAEQWLRAGELQQLERTTLVSYRQQVDLHIVPFIGSAKLADLNAPQVRWFQDALHAAGRSGSAIRRVVRSLGSILTDAQERGQVGHNAVRELSRNRKRQTERRHKGKPKIGVDIPTPAEVAGIIAGAKGRWRPLLVTAAFTGLRASELRGLRWSDVELDAGKLHVRQRADRFGKIGRPKSASSERVVPFGKIVANTLREWRLACPKGEMDLVFPNGAGKVEGLSNIVIRGLMPTQGSKAKYTGMHCLRHFYASWCINAEADGGLGLPPKVVQERLGHSTIGMTMDTYGHLFPASDDGEKLDAAELRLIKLA
jgi:integrase